MGHVLVTVKSSAVTISIYTFDRESMSVEIRSGLAVVLVVVCGSRCFTEQRSSEESLRGGKHIQ